MRHWYSIQNTAEPAHAELLIYDTIGPSWSDDSAVTAKQFVQELQALPSSVTKISVRVNSPGGNPFDAVAIANALREQRTLKKRSVEMTIDGLAASAASIVIMAGSPIRIAKNALVMVHDPLSIGIGNSTDFRKIADDLDRVRDVIVATYRWNSSLSDEELRGLMRAETWMDADEAIAKGFATETTEAVTAQARFTASALSKFSIPDKHRRRAQSIFQPDHAAHVINPLDIYAARRAATVRS